MESREEQRANIEIPVNEEIISIADVMKIQNKPVKSIAMTGVVKSWIRLGKLEINQPETLKTAVYTARSMDWFRFEFDIIPHLPRCICAVIQYEDGSTADVCFTGKVF